MIERISKIIENEQISVRAFEQKINASNGLIRKAIANNTDIQSKWISAIVENYPQYNTEWLVTGKGDMLKTDTPVSEPKQMTSDNTVVLNLVDRIEKLSAENAVLKREIEELKEEIRNKSNPNTYASAVAEP